MFTTQQQRAIKMTKRAYAVIAAGFLTVSISFSIRYGYGMLLPEMVPDLGISKAQAGAIFAAYFAVYTIATPILGALTDRFNYRLILTLFTTVLACGAILMAFAHTLWQACLFFAVAGLGHAACWAPVAALVQKWVPNHRRGTALSVVTMGLGVGLPLWSMILPAMVKASDWRAGWIGLGIVCLGVAALNFILVRNPEKGGPPGNRLHPPKPKFWESYRKIVKDRVFWIIGTGYFFVGVTVIIPYGFVPVYAREALGLPYSEATRMVAVIALTGIVGQLTLGPLSDTIGRIRVMMTCSFTMGSACLGLALSTHPWMLYLFSGCFGLGYGAVWSAYGAAASDFFPKEHTGGIMGLWTCILGLGSVISPVICGWTIDMSGGYFWAFVLGLVNGVLSAVVLAGVGAHRRPA
jgi:MFS family permease